MEKTAMEDSKLISDGANRKKVICRIPLSALKPDLVSSIVKPGPSSADKANTRPAEPPVSSPETRPRTIRTKAALKLFPEEMMSCPEFMPQQLPPSQTEPVQDDLQSGPVKIVIRLAKLDSGSGQELNQRKRHKHRRGKYPMYELTTMYKRTDSTPSTTNTSN